MINKKIKRLHISHSDLDGSIPFLLDTYFGEDFDATMSMNYHDFEREDFSYDIFKNYDEIVITDFSLDQKALDIVIENGTKLTILDHHKSWYDIYQENKEKLESLENKGLIEIHFDNTKSGTLIYFEYLKAKHNKRVSKIVTDIVELANTYDLFKTDTELWEDALSLNRMLWKLYNWFDKDTLEIKKFSRFLKMLQSKIDTQSSFSYNMYERNAIADTKDKEQDAYKKAISNMLIRTDKEGNKFGVVKMGAKVSIVAHNILKNFTQLSYILIINDYVKDDLKLSGRARNGYNLLRLNYLRGHKEATGSEPLENELLEKLWNGRYMYELGLKENYAEEPNEELDIIHRIY